MATLWRGYLRLLAKYPLATMCSTTGTLMAAGDGISQLCIERCPVKNYDIPRSGRFFVLGFFALGPMLRFWYLALDKMYSGTKMAALKMVVTDQTVGAPVVLFTFVTGMGVLRGESRDEIMKKVHRDYFTILINNYKIWPAAQAINFFFMPLQHRVLFVNFVALGWNTFLAWITEGKEKAEQN
ncbi:mitochondrial inner membrane protein Mpv17-like [Babylonia areolata]|uniref:mitochondrial inner membrane protein Mpv17-like n=1 Tax=Babylonia areolata TaxID=304850 RepID=UPI003FD26BF4